MNDLGIPIWIWYIVGVFIMVLGWLYLGAGLAGLMRLKAERRERGNERRPE